MRTRNLIVTAVLVGGAAACSGGGQDTMTGTRFDGVKVQCTSSGDGVAQCAPVSPDDACDVVNVLWPPNHKMVQFTLADCAPPPSCGDGGGSGSGSGDGGGSGSGSGSGDGSGSGGGIGIIMRTASDVGPSATAKITSITADEAVDVGAGGDGHTTTADIKIIDGTTFQLRSERQGGGDGRVYWVHWADDAGVVGACEFDVPHDQGPAHGAVDSGVVVTVTP